MIVANVLQPLIDVFEGVMRFFHNDVGVSWGTSIILLTITIRALLLPLTLKQVKSMQALQRIAPHMKEVQAKYKEDKQRQQQEMMKLYQEHKVNPFASCLPLLAQLPVFISLFYMLRRDLRHDICPDINPSIAHTRPCGETPESNFFFIPDITNKAVGTVLVVLIVLYVATQLASSLLMSVSADRNQRMIFLALPFLFIPFVIGFPAGLLLYWITTNLWTIVQQFIVRKTVGVVKPPSADAGGGGPGRARAPTDDATPSSSDKSGPSPRPEPAVAGPSATRRTSAPPPPPGKRKKKRSGRRR
jgi:YidC/Oxa1 family membrane protein insertase